MIISSYKTQVFALAVLAFSPAVAQVSSHAPTQMKAMTASPATAQPASGQGILVSDKPVVRVNGVVLTERDLVREMLAIFPYARQHNGFPKEQEAQIRQGALRMIEFEELVYQEAQRRKLTVPPEKLAHAEAQFRSQFSSKEEFSRYLKAELNGSRALLRQRISRSLLIEMMLKSEVNDRSKISLVEARDFYNKNPQSFEYKENFSIQTISILPPETASAAEKKNAHERAEDALRKAKATKSYEEFGLLAEKVSEDDFHVNMGDHKKVDRDKLPPPIVTAALNMKPGQVSDMLQFGPYYTFFRLNAHTLPGRVTFEEAKAGLLKDLQKEKHERLRVELDKKLRKNAKIEEL